MKKLYVKIDGMSCSHCEETLKNALLSLKNVKSVEFNGFVAVISYTNKLDHNLIIKTVKDKSYFTKEEYISDDIKELDTKIKLKEFIIITLSIISFSIILNKIFGYNIFNMIPTISTNTTYKLLFVTGLLTSIHCISMCASINLVATINTGRKKSLKRPILYNLGRLISYTLLGGVVGLIGNVLSVNSIISKIIVILAATFMFLMSLNMLGIIKLTKIRFLKYKTNTRNPFVIGLLNGFMPCGPLQAMQMVALSTKSFFKGAFSMFCFCSGTIPLMLLAGVILNLVDGKLKIVINKIAAIIIMLLSLVMINNALSSFDINISKVFNSDKTFQKSIIKKDYQEIKINLDYDNYQDIMVQKGIKVKMIIHVSKDKLTGCNNEIIINKYNIKKKLEVGDNVIFFTPTNVESFNYTCYMNMIKNNIKVVDNKKIFKGENK